MPNLAHSGGIIISTKQARKLLGKPLSDQLSDEDLTRLIGQLQHLTEAILDSQIVPKNEEGGIIEV